jgi:hypothetical protein
LPTFVGGRVLCGECNGSHGLESLVLLIGFRKSECINILIYVINIYKFIDEVVEVVPGTPAPQFEDESLSARYRGGSKFKRILCFVMINVRYFALSPKVSLSTPKTTPTPGLRLLL